jgi:hypothetical protein
MSRKKVRLRKQLNYQFIFVIILFCALMLAVAGITLPYFKSGLSAFSFGEKVRPVKTESAIQPVSVIPDLFMPIIKDSGSPPAAVDATRQRHGHKAPAPARPISGSERPSQECKDAATSQWITDRVLTNSNIPSAMYLNLLRQSVAQTALVRRLCMDQSLVSQLTEAAKTGVKPAWIKKEIELRAREHAEAD